MKKISAATILIAFFLSALLYAEDVPRPSGWLNDLAGVVSSGEHDKITSIISELEQKTGAEVFVLTVESIAPYDEKSYARMVFDSWKPGKKGKDNGALIMLAVKDRLWRIETGYGLEGILPDGRCGEVGRNYMVSYFKQGLYGEGLYNGVLAISNIIANDAGVKLSLQPVEDASGSPINDWLIYVIFFAMILLLFVLPRFITYRNKDGSRDDYFGGGFRGGGFGGGGFGGGGGGGGGGGAGGRF